MAQVIPPSFIEKGPKLRVLIIVIREWPKTAKKRGEPQKMTHSSKTDFFWVGLNGKVVAPGKLVMRALWLLLADGALTVERGS